MKKIITLLAFLIITISLQAQFTTLWEKSAAQSALPSWFSSSGSTERGFAYGNVGGNDRVYVVSRNGGNTVRVVNATDGSDVGTLDLTGVSGGLYLVSDAEVSDDGIIYVCNMTLNASTNAFKVYSWSSEGGVATNVISYTGLAERMGDKFTVIGSASDNSLTIYAAGISGTNIIKFTTADNGASFSSTTITLPAATTAGSASVGPLSSGTSDFYLNSGGKSVTKHQSDGTLIGTLPGTIVASGSNAIRFLKSSGTDEFAATFAYGTGNENARVFKVPAGVPSNGALYFTTTALGTNSNSNGTGDIDIQNNGDGTYTIYVLSTNNGFGAYKTSPIIDGQFDGVAAWGTSKATDGDGSWGDVSDLDDLYVTYDDTYAYFGAKYTSVADWLSWGFSINTIDGQGGTTEVWTYPIDYGYSQAPDFVIKGHFGQGGSPYAELRSWDGGAWSLVSSLATTEYTSDESFQMVEVRIPLATLGNPTDGDVQFYISGNNGAEHGAFDSMPDDAQADSWNVSANHTILDNYVTAVPLPVELTSFTALPQGEFVNLTWETATEVNNYGFEILRSAQNDNANWENVGFVEGHGNSNSVKQYSFTDNTVIAGQAYSYRLKQIDFDGQFEFSSIVNVEAGIPTEFNLEQNYPNPFNPTTSISFSLPKAAQVNLSIYNVLGEKVAQLINTQMEAGKHNINFNASNLSTGTYIYRIETPEFSTSKKMMLVK